MKKKKKENFTVTNADSCLPISAEVRDVFYPCDYCGGRNERIESYSHEIIGIQFDFPLENIYMKCCPWCWKKVFDIALGKPKKKK